MLPGREVNTMDDVEVLGTTTPDTLCWEHEAVTQAGRLLDDKRCGLAAIDGFTLLQKGFEIRRALPDGSCALHVSLGRGNTQASGVELHTYRMDVVETCIDAVFGDGWVDDQEVPAIARDRLASLGFMGGVTCFATEHGCGRKVRRRKTNEEVIASLPDQAKGWLAVSQFGVGCLQQGVQYRRVGTQGGRGDVAETSANRRPVTTYARCTPQSPALALATTLLCARDKLAGKAGDGSVC